MLFDYLSGIKKQYIVIIRLLYESFMMAWHSIITNKIRTFLTLLGITIGIFSIIIVFSAVDSLERGIKNNISSLGSDVIYVQKWPWSFEKDYKWWEYLKRPVPKYSDYIEIVKKAQSVEVAAFSVSTYRQIKYKKNIYDNGLLWANTYDFNKIRSFDIEKGRYFTQIEDKSGKNLCIIGVNIEKNLFGNEEPLDKYLLVDGRKLKIIGVIKKEGAGLFGGSLDDLVIIPLNYARNIIDIRSDYLNPLIMLKAKENVPLEQMRDEVRNILRRKHALKNNQNDDFSLNQANMIISGINQIFKILNLAGWLIGGFGIANIMFVTVRERTNQIGIQKALGAKSRFILIEFLFEGIMLALVGGLLGLIIVYLSTLIISNISEFKMMLSFGNIMMGIVTSTIIGLIAGLWPAWTAARLHPVEAINTSF